MMSMGMIVLALYTFQREAQPDPNLISLAVRATVFAMPSPSPLRIEVTREVEVTRVVEVVRYVEVTATPTPTPTFTATPVASVPDASNVAAAAAFADTAAEAHASLAREAPPAPDVLLAAGQPANQTASQPSTSGDGCPVTSARHYNAIPVAGGGAEHPPAQHGDLNLALRGYEPAEATLGLLNIDGPSDGDPPQLPGVLGRAATIAQTFRARDWNWACGGAGCRGEPLTNVEVSLVGLATSPGEAIHVPTRGAEIYGGGYVALVLFADTTRLTVVYTREDSVANGYTVHLEDFCVDPNLLALYHANHAAGRSQLPGVRNGEVVGSARYHQVLVGVRDRGSFTDPRSRKDWWRGY